MAGCDLLQKSRSAQALTSVGGMRWLGLRRWLGDAAPLWSTCAANTEAMSRPTRRAAGGHSSSNGKARMMC